MSLLCAVAAAAGQSAAQVPAKQHCTAEPARVASDADRAMLAGDAAGAETLYAAQVKTSPSAQAYAGLIRAQLEQNKVSEALASGKADTAANPTSGLAYASLGDVLIRLGQVPEASLAVAKALSLDQCSARAHFGWGRLNGLQSRHATEAHELAAAHALSPFDAEVTAAWVEVQPEEKREAAISVLLANKPLLAPAVVARLATEAAELEQHKLCTQTQPITNAKLELQPIPYEGNYTRSWALKLKVNDAALALVELDSSVDGIVLNPKDALKAGVHAIGPAPASPTATYTAIADRIQIGPLEFHDCPVRVASSAQLAGANSLIGTSFFRNNLIHVSYADEALTLSPLPVRTETAGHVVEPFVAPEERDWAPVYVAGSTLLVPTMLDKKGPFLFMIDTGSWSPIMSPLVVSRLLTAQTDVTVNRVGMSADIVKIVPHEGGVLTDRADIRGADGALLKVTRPAKLPTIRFANNANEDSSTLSFDLSGLSHGTGVEVAGLLGFRILQQYDFDLNYRDGLVHFVFDQNRRYAVREANKHVLGNPY